MEGRYLPRHSGVGVSGILDLKKYFNEYGVQVFDIGKPDKEALKKYFCMTEEEVAKLECIFSFQKLLPQIANQIQLPYEGFKPNFANQDVPESALTLTSLRALQRRSKKENEKLNKTVLGYRGEVDLDVNEAAMFYLGNNFYVDTRNPESGDYSPKFREWGAARGYMLGNTFKMEEATWQNVMELRLGYPYLYVHQTFCEHLIILTDARYLVYNNDRLPLKVAHFCTICLNLFNYMNGMKTGNFQVYKYVDRASLI